MDGRGISFFVLTCALTCGCLPSQLAPTNEHKPPVVQETPEPAEPTSLNPFASKPKREPRFELHCAIYCERKAAGFKDEPEKQHKELDEARKIYQDILTYDDKYLEAYRGLGRVYAAQRDFARAKATYVKAMQLYPKHAQLLEDLSVVHSMQNDFAGAIQLLNRAIEMEPENRDFMFRLAVNLVQVGQLDRGVEMMSRARGRAAGHYFVARTLARLNRADEARQHARIAVDFNPNYAEARNFLAELDQGRTPVNPPNPNPVANVGLQLDE